MRRTVLRKQVFVHLPANSVDDLILLLLVEVSKGFSIQVRCHPVTVWSELSELVQPLSPVVSFFLRRPRADIDPVPQL
jgi:hypothetical protein